MRLKALIPILAAVFVPALAVGADAVPSPRAGVWETDIKLGGVSMGTLQLCVGDSMPDMLVRMKAANPQTKPGEGCADRQIRRTDKGFEQEMTCTSAGHKTHVLMAGSGDLQSVLHMTSTVTVDGVARPPVLTDMRWVGQCPAGFEPGQSRSASDPSKQAAAIEAVRKQLEAGKR